MQALRINGELIRREFTVVNDKKYIAKNTICILIVIGGRRYLNYIYARCKNYREKLQRQGERNISAQEKYDNVNVDVICTI